MNNYENLRITFWIKDNLIFIDYWCNKFQDYQVLKIELAVIII